LSPIVSQLSEREGYHLTDYIASRQSDESIVLKGSPQHNALAWLSHAIVCMSSQNQNNVNANEFEYDCMSLLSRSQLLDRYALATMYFAWNGKSWRNSQGWLTYHSGSVPRSSKNSIWSIDVRKLPSDVCLWQGVICRHELLTIDDDTDNNGDSLVGNNTKNTMNGNESRNTTTENDLLAEKGEQQQIVGLVLTENNLIGYMGAVKEIRLLAYLEDLNLSQNHLKGLVPKDLSQLEELRNLDLSHNFLSGTLPASIPKNLEVFKLENNFLVGGLDAGIRFAPPCSNTEAPLLWKEFSADCSGAKPKVLCPCCTKCCGRSNTSNLSAVPKAAGSLRGASKNETESTVCQEQTIPETSAATDADTFATVGQEIDDDDN